MLIFHLLEKLSTYFASQLTVWSLDDPVKFTHYENVWSGTRIWDLSPVQAEL